MHTILSIMGWLSFVASAWVVVIAISRFRTTTPPAELTNDQDGRP